MGEHFYLAHHGIKGMKWGVRRFQNEDGSLTGAGKQRYKIRAIDGDGFTSGGKIKTTRVDAMDGDGFTNRRTKQQQDYVDRYGIAPKPTRPPQ